VRSDCPVDKRLGWAGNRRKDGVGACTGSKMSALLSGMDEGDAYLPHIHFFVAHTKIMYSVSAREIGGQGWVDDLHVRCM
jgi:hypothetical protein